jgi:hypothetical protein
VSRNIPQGPAISKKQEVETNLIFLYFYKAVSEKSFGIMWSKNHGCIIQKKTGFPHCDYAMHAPSVSR